ncbi:MAG TPA: hypothetical protein VFV35_01850 [Acidimicrobiales bacterium]|nr:hypothetical protein [Acidimicrobiales bacterium]
MIGKLDPSARAWVRGAAAGGMPAILAHLWLALGPDSSLFGKVTNGHFYEVQARSLLEGRWDIPADSIGAERFRVGDRFYEYFGPWPAVLRIPVVAFTDGLDGRLSRVAVLCAMALFGAGCAALLWQVRALLVADARRVDRRAQVSVAVFVFLCGCATPALFLPSWTAVYHEAIAWGMAWSVVAYALVLAHLRSGSRRLLVAASAATALALLSRSSVGLGPLVALGFVVALRVSEIVRRGSERAGPALRSVGDAAAAAAAPLALHAYVGWAKFGSLTGIPPIGQQDLLVDWPGRAPALAANGGSLFGVGYAPTIVFQYLRPDGFRLDRLFPWFGFGPEPTVVGGAVFEALNPSASLAATSPLALLVAVVGAVSLVRRRTLFAAVVVAGGAAGCVGALSVAFVDQRYQGDLVPLLVVLGALGWTVLSGATAGRAIGRAAVFAAGAALAWSAWANGGLGWQYQHGWSMAAGTDSRAGMVTTQLTVHERLGGGLPSRVDDAAPQPRAQAPPHSLAVVGRCRSVLWSDGREWHPVETSSATGRFVVDVGGAPRPDRASPLLAIRDDAGVSSLSMAQGVVTYRWMPSDAASKGVVLRSSRAMRGDELRVRLDRPGIFAASTVEVTDRGGTLVSGTAPFATGPPVDLAPGATVHDPPMPICDRLTRLGLRR